MDDRFSWKRTWLAVLGAAVAGLIVVQVKWGGGGASEGVGKEGTGAAAVSKVPISFEGVSLYPGRKRDEIPAIDRPVFAMAPPNTAAMSDDDWVVGVQRGEVARAYPLWVLARREIVNDRFGAEAICVTYCPLSASVVAFRSRLGDRDLVFGNEGALYECNLVMYDLGSGSLWYQLRGLAIHGARTGETLSMVPAELIRWGAWRRRYPEGQILVADERTGRFFRVAEGKLEHEGPASAEPEAPVSRMDPVLKPMERVWGCRMNGRAVCFVGATLEALPGGRYAVPGGVGAWVETGRDGGLRVRDGGGETLPLLPAYWFAWFAAYPSGLVVSNLPAWSNP